MHANSPRLPLCAPVPGPCAGQGAHGQHDAAHPAHGVVHTRRRGGEGGSLRRPGSLAAGDRRTGRAEGRMGTGAEDTQRGGQLVFTRVKGMGGTETRRGAPRPGTLYLMLAPTPWSCTAMVAGRAAQTLSTGLVYGSYWPPGGGKVWLASGTLHRVLPVCYSARILVHARLSSSWCMLACGCSPGAGQPRVPGPAVQAAGGRPAAPPDHGADPGEGRNSRSGREGLFTYGSSGVLLGHDVRGTCIAGNAGQVAKSYWLAPALRVLALHRSVAVS